MFKKIDDNLIWFFIIMAELVLIAFFIFYFNFFSNQMTTASSPIKESNLTSSTSTELDYYYGLESGKWSASPAPGWLDNYPDIVINKDGLNDRFNYSVEKSPNTYRIVTLGDSWTFGMYVDTDDNYPEQLEAVFNNECRFQEDHYEVINLGVGGYNITYSAERFIRKGKKYNPDLVVWLVFNNDFNDNLEFLNEKAMNYREEKIKSYYKKNIDDNLPNKQEIDWKRYLPESKLAEISRKSWVKARELQSNRFTEDEVIEGQIQTIRSLLDSTEANFLFVSLEEGGRSLNSKHRKALEKITNSRSDAYHATIKNDLKGDLVFPDTHPTAEGYERVAEKIGSVLFNKDFVECNISN